MKLLNKLLLFFLITSYAFSAKLVILGTVQDAGSPHIGCEKSCCEELWDKPDSTRLVTSLGLIIGNKKFVFEASPDFTKQANILNSYTDTISILPNGIFLTHAHIGHYTGLMFLGREAISSKSLPVYAMPKMKNFIETNGPWSQLVKLDNIEINQLEDKKEVDLEGIKVIPFRVPHRDEFSETVGYKIIGKEKTALFIPDIDKWQKWEKDIIEEVKKVNYAFLDATFFDSKELNYRDISEIPHPFVIETMKLFEDESTETKAKIHFIHFNHTNEALDKSSEEYKTIIKNGFKVAEFLMEFEL
jgi:pyrroloquinoline quinone biosynthesis protein B